jgi:hypothetical protein
MDWNQVRSHLKQMEGRRLASISGRSDVRVTEVGDDYITLKTAANDSKTRPLQELRKIVDKMNLNLPVHVDSILGGSGSSRNQPETILANLPDVEWMRIDERKHLVWLGRKTHELGTIRQADAFTLKSARQALADANARDTASPVSMAVFSSHMSRATQLLSTIFQGASTQPLGSAGVYSITSALGSAILFPIRHPEEQDPRILACVSVPNADEAANRIRSVYPDSETEVIHKQPKLIIVKFNNGAELALTDARQSGT